MNYTQNHKIAQVTESTLVVGVDIGSEQHYARAWEWTLEVSSTMPEPSIGED